MTIARTTAALREAIARHGAASARRVVGFVPTMGALHDGHAALIAAARRECTTVVVSVFVNPTQFNDPADLAAYPRDEARDAAIAGRAGADLLFAPDAAEMYPPGHATTVEVRGAAIGFEGDARPGHFAGVATVCVGLFGVVRPDRAYFGQKDAQQVAVVQQVVRDLHLPLQIVVVPTMRDADGLALSSRNARLSAAERARAAAVPAAVRAGLAAHRAGQDPVAAARTALAGLDVGYVGLATLNGDPTLVIAVRIGTTRLIDNVPLDHPERAGL